MAFSSGNGGAGRGGRRGRRNSGSLSEINIVPLVDVVLVLLVIFMLTAHVMEFGLDIEVPKVRAVSNSAQELPVVSVTKRGEVYLNESHVNLNELAGEVRKRFKGANAIYLKADGQTTWDLAVQVIAMMGEAKLDVRVVTQLDEGGQRGR